MSGIQWSTSQGLTSWVESVPLKFDVDGESAKVTCCLYRYRMLCKQSGPFRQVLLCFVAGRLTLCPGECEYGWHGSYPIPSPNVPRKILEDHDLEQGTVLAAMSGAFFGERGIMVAGDHDTDFDVDFCTTFMVVLEID